MKKFCKKRHPARSVKRWLALLLCVCLIGTMLPIPARAELELDGFSVTGKPAGATVKTINLNAAVLRPDSTWSSGGNLVYFGSYDSSPVAYRVLSSPSTQTDSGQYLLLDCDTILKTMIFSSALFSGIWMSSNCIVSNWLNGTEFYAGSVFSGIEKTAIAETALVEQDGYIAGEDIHYKDYSVTNHVFCLSAAEADGLYADNASRKKTGSNNAAWWLRSDRADTDDSVGIVHSDGRLDYDSRNTVNVGVSPALNVNLSSVLFASESGTGKSSALASVDGTDAREWKLTLLDSSKTVNITSGQSVERTDAGGSTTITVPYTYTDSNTTNPVSQISVMITDKAYTDSSAQVLYYGALQDTTITSGGASGTGTFTLPADLADKSCGADYYAYIIAEDVNGAKESDYASTPCAITIPAQKKYTVTVTNGTLNSGSTTGEYLQGETVTITANATSTGQQFKGWTVVNGTISLASSTSETTTFTMPAEAVSVKAGYDEIIVAPTNNKGLGISIIADPAAPAATTDAWKGSYVYFGTYNSNPVKYRVLDRNTTDFGGTTMLLDCDSILWAGTNSDNQSSRFDDSSNVWADSEIKTYLNDTFLRNHFTSLEQAAIAASSKANAGTTDGNGWSELNYAALSGEQIFLLDAKEATNINYGYSNTYQNATNRKKAGGKDWWWLRSAVNNEPIYAGVVHLDGNLGEDIVERWDEGVSPALNVDLSSVLFSSVLSGTAGQPGAEYKLTLQDGDMTITPGTVTRNLSDVITVPYAIGGTNAGNATQVSLMLLDKEYTAGNTNGAKLVAYEKITDVDSANISAAGISGTGTFTLTNDMKNGSYYYYIVAEDVQVNNTDTVDVDEGLFTDYASAPQPITIPARPTEITSVDITIPQPVPGHNLAGTAAVSTTGVTPASPVITWKKGSETVTGAAGYNSTYTAEVTLSPAAGYVFGSGVTANIKVDGTTVGSGTVSVNTNGSITVSYTFDATGKANITGITNPAAITGMANGTAKTATALGLPTAVTITTEDGDRTATVTWNLTNLASGTYDPSVLTEQTFTVDGDVTLPSDIANGSNIPLKASVQVTVVAAGFVSEPTANPAEGTYTANQSVTLTSSTEGAKIYYTTDGSEPTLTGGTLSGTTKEYTAPVEVTGTEGQSVQTTIKAIAVKDRMQDSGVAEFPYTIQIPDATAPTAEIQIDEDRWTSFRNTLDFSYFFKNSKSVSITASDNVTANPKIKYYLSDEVLSQTEAQSDSIFWTDYSGAFRINANSKKIVYAKVTDDAGNTTIINSNGVVVYTDSAQADTGITCTRLSGEDKSFAVTLNGNTINQVTISSTANVSLTQPVKDTDYTIADNQVTLKGAYLDTLPAGDYTITISYHPMGVPYQERQNSAGYDPNDEPATTTVNLKVEKIAGTVSVTGNPGKTYDGTPVSVNFDRNNNAGDVVVEYKAQGAADSSYHTTAPKNAGNYTVRVTVKADAAGNYTEAAATKDFSITPKELTVDVAVADKQYDGLATAEISGTPVLSGVISRDDVSLTNGTPAFTKVAAGENIPVTFTDFSITGADAANYKLLQPTGVTASIFNRYHAAQNTDYTVNSNGWINEDFVVTAKEGYELSKTYRADGTWSSTLSATEETADGSLAFYVRNKATGAISNPVAENYKIDKTVPTAEINVGTNSWNQFWNTVTFGHFFKNTKSVTITASDNMPAAPTVEYLLADREFTKDQLTTGVTWTDYTGAFGINANSKKIIYAKVTDEAGNTIIVNSAGIVVYTDSASDTTEITYVKNVTGDVNAKVTLNGNTVAGIQNGSNALTDGTDYTVDADGKITFKEAYLKTLAAGTYTLTISYDPMGESYVQGDENEAANTTELVLTVRVMESAAENEKNEKVPLIKGKNGKEGWDAIRDEVGNTKAGDTVTVDMNGTTVVPGDIFSDIKGKDITIVFDMGGGITWSVNGMSVTADQLGEIDFAVKTNTTNIPVDVINKVTGERVSMQISLKHEGGFGFAATLTINLEPKNKGLYANLFYFNPKAEKGSELEFICADEIDEKGNANLLFTHASDYTIVIDKEPMQAEEPGVSAPKKGTLLTDRKTKMVYKIIKSGRTGGTVQFVKTGNTKAKTIAIPDKVTIDGITYKVTSIAANALKNNKVVTKVTIGKYVTSIGSGAFSGCSKLKKVTIGKSVTTIGSKAFYKCTSLTSITIPSKVTKIGDYAFKGCSKLKTIKLNTTLLTTKTVSEKAFSGISTSAVIKVPKRKLKSYKKLFVKKGLSKKVTIRNL